MDSNEEPIIALIPWGNVIEDYLDTIGISLEKFCTEMTGGWLFGYIEALKLAGVRTLLICISSRITVPTRRIHQPTGAVVCIVPIGKTYLSLRHRMVYAYGSTVEETFGDVSGLKKGYFSWLRHLSPYLATPLRQLAKELKQEGCQAILCQEYEYPRFDHCVLLGKLTGIPVFATFQGGNFQTWQLEKWIRPLTIRACAGLIVASQTEIERVKCHYGIPSDKIAQIFNPLDLNFWKKRESGKIRAHLGIPLNAKVVICHGRIERDRKGLDILLDAWQKICQTRCQDNLRLLLVGTGNDAPWLRQAIAAMSLTNIIWIDKYILDRTVIVNYLSDADIYTLSSRHEGFPVAPLEAMACGLPIVATDVPGIADILAKKEEDGGFIVPRDDASALAESIGRLLDNERLRLELGQRARRRLEKAFSLEVVGQKLQQWIERSVS